MTMAMSLSQRWLLENNDIVNKWKQQDSGDQDQSRLKLCSAEILKLLRIIRGQRMAVLGLLPQLELTVVYNACVLSLSQSLFSEAEQLLTQCLETVLEPAGRESVTSDPPVFWRAVLKSLGDTDLRFCTLQLLCLQWAIWLSTCRLEHIQALQEELSSLSEELVAGCEERTEGERRLTAAGKSSETGLVVLDPRELKELLQICTVIAQGAEWLTEGRSSEALPVLQRGCSLPAPRPLLANAHFLSGLCLARMGRPQMALQHYRKAIETDPCCVCALHQSMLIYRDLGNTQAEIQALRLLHSTLMLPSGTDSLSVGTLLCPSLLLRSQSLRRLLAIPSPLSVLHSLALKCVLHGRVSEGVEHYLDLLAALQSDDQHTVHAGLPTRPRLPELYLEAGYALLKAQRPADCTALCDEVISLTLELLPEKLLLEERMECETETGDGSPDGLSSDGDKLEMLLWAGAAHLLQAHCQSHLKDWKQAVTHYTRCINLLVKVCIKKKAAGFQSPGPCEDVAGRQGSGLCTLQRLKGLSLAGRGISFTQRDQLKEALRDLQLSLQTSPGCASAGLWLGEVLWRLGRRREAAACWEKTWSSNAGSSVEALPLYLQDLQSVPFLDPTVLHCRIKEFAQT